MLDKFKALTHCKNLNLIWWFVVVEVYPHFSTQYIL